MKPVLKATFLAATVVVLASCSTTLRKPVYRPTAAHKIQPVRINNIDHTEGPQELMLHSMRLAGTPHRWGGNRTKIGPGYSGMTQFAYRNALGVNLLHITRDTATASRKTPDGKLETGDLVLFGMDGTHKYSHVGLYIGNDEFVYAPSSGKTVQTGELSKPFCTKNYLDTHTFPTD